MVVSGYSRTVSAGCFDQRLRGFDLIFSSAFATLKHLNSECLCLKSDFCKWGGEKKKGGKSGFTQDGGGRGAGGSEQVQLLSFSSPIQLAVIHLCCHGILAAQ